MTEQWRPIAGYEGLYEVSDQGRVRSLDRRDAAGREVSGHVLRPSTHRTGHLLVTLSRGGARKGYTVHSLVAAAFIGPRPVGQVIRHLDDVPANNLPGNLVYGTQVENWDDSVRNGSRLRSQVAHGTSNTYTNHGCRCQPCTDAATEASRRQRAARKARRAELAAP